MSPSPTLKRQLMKIDSLTSSCPSSPSRKQHPLLHPSTDRHDIEEVAMKLVGFFTQTILRNTIPITNVRNENFQSDIYCELLYS